MRRRVLLLAIVGAVALVSACGQVAELKPRAGHTLPVAPHGREDQPSASALLVPQPQASPERNVELRSKSEQRKDDPFDLPPE